MWGSHKPKQLGEGAHLLLLFPNSELSHFLHQTPHDAPCMVLSLSSLTGTPLRSSPLAKETLVTGLSPACKQNPFSVLRSQQMLTPSFLYWKNSNKPQARIHSATYMVSANLCLTLKKEVVQSGVLGVNRGRPT